MSLFHIRKVKMKAKKNHSMLHIFFCLRTHYPEGMQTLYCQTRVRAIAIQAS